MSFAAVPPDPGAPGSVVIWGAFGAFVGALIATARGLSRERTREVAENWAFAATAAALVAYLFGPISGVY